MSKGSSTPENTDFRSMHKFFNGLLELIMRYIYDFKKIHVILFRLSALRLHDGSEKKIGELAPSQMLISSLIRD